MKDGLLSEDAEFNEQLICQTWRIPATKTSNLFQLEWVAAGD
jgi:hypothetical protein